MKRLSNLDDDRTLHWQSPFPLIRQELSPFKDFYATFPEPFLCYINEEEVRDPAKGKHLSKVVKLTFARYGIDFLHPSFHLEHARKKLYQFFQNAHKGRVQIDRLKELFEGDGALKKYIDRRVHFIDQILGDDCYDGMFIILILEISVLNI